MAICGTCEHRVSGSWCERWGSSYGYYDQACRSYKKESPIEKPQTEKKSPCWNCSMSGNYLFCTVHCSRERKF